ncbi:hypothetical protein [Microcystis aeruginosa]|jgi:hypothetical protein|uniref:Late competence development ComFB family protein n=2 Tax=Microcystis TaxID=1125 RepID=A0A552HPQ6_MICVR|nr:hypothetical protein [Microcystis aeruginosa]NCR08906.1 hypothetical protein [Microcystis aeruginosa LG13-11]TRU68487.1 MAG: hypothetical protein EWV55_23445 [Microcystis viridis Mv_BB_P_19951000_S69]TRU73225.1 MAG: hypothetical protein EWV77_12210 [Microcystis viridis Mv_BB_P_19951000_S68D]TRU75701.1 MAG: hypothetical protein EWV47_07945 [Microcystis viridis Mv_BB_P_19951000_S68]TRU87055.1 MAG: hypothetical protein EWV46_08915 [Microcystis viridis Mv_BB_P_19951000_S69D]
MNQPSLNFVEQLVIVEVKEQLRNLPASFRQYLSETKIDRVMNNAIQLLPRSFKTLAEKYHDPHTRRLRIRIAVERAITDMLDDLKFYYVAQTEVEDEENIPTELYAKK